MEIFVECLEIYVFVVERTNKVYNEGFRSIQVEMYGGNKSAFSAEGFLQLFLTNIYIYIYTSL